MCLCDSIGGAANIAQETLLEPMITELIGCFAAHVQALTNVALLLKLYPEVKDKLKQIVLMGGAIGVGNISPVAEFNIL